MQEHKPLGLDEVMVNGTDQKSIQQALDIRIDQMRKAEAKAKARTTEPMKRYSPLPYRTGMGATAAGQYLDRDDIPVESLHVAVLLMQEHADKFENPATKKHYENLRAALERLLGACEP